MFYSIGVDRFLLLNIVKKTSFESGSIPLYWGCLVEIHSINKNIVDKNKLRIIYIPNVHRRWISENLKIDFDNYLNYEFNRL